MSVPISAIRVSAVLRSTPGMVARSSTFSEKGAITRSISTLTARFTVVELEDNSQHARNSLERLGS